ncbi:hypothetical protein ABIA38_007398 [Embleya sp. AB8]
MQFWIYDLPADTPLATLVRLAKLRWRIEHDYREMKQALGLAHFEGCTWNGWHHHVTLGLGRARLLHPPTTGQSPKSNGAGLTLYQVVRELQTLLAAWTGA